MEKYVYYVCSKCNAASDEMVLISIGYTPSVIEKKMFPEICAEYGNELLKCKCGNVTTWFDMKKKEEQFPDGAICLNYFWMVNCYILLRSENKDV